MLYTVVDKSVDNLWVKHISCGYVFVDRSTLIAVTLFTNLL